MILSVSRRTDIPAFYSDWFMNRIREGYVMTRNPMNYHAVSKISLTPDVVDCIVFWSKNPKPLFKFLDEISKEYTFYFQFTLNAYEKDLEPHLPTLEERISTFKALSEKYGKERVIWRYDPVMLSDKYTSQWHINSFRGIIDQLSEYTTSCVFSFVDVYDKVKNNLKNEKVIPFTKASMDELARGFSEIASHHSIILKTCAEELDLSKFGIEHSRCIDPNLISQLAKCDISIKKDKNQRNECGCAESIDIGQYNTCMHGCKYCYANYSQTSVRKCYEAHFYTSPLLIGDIENDDKIKERKVKSLKENQISLFDAK